ncbi:hypothetical protein F7725_024140 [Dissostichus mawsoni]|uniref:Uncharacterized protein n=1 Tax=Dissostichus mawsoni TaxID=36200 RepID=A0A7J5Y026_DISMA|nr:hypothetical protein F7725_024140 [Dissostichus mawsoni]
MLSRARLWSDMSLLLMCLTSTDMKLNPFFTVHYVMAWDRTHEWPDREIPGAQPMTPDLFKSETQDLDYKSTLNHFQQLNEDNKCVQSSHVPSVSLSDIAAAGKGRHVRPDYKLIEVKEVSDGLNVCYSGDTLTLESFSGWCNTCFRLCRHSSEAKHQSEYGGHQ